MPSDVEGIAMNEEESLKAYFEERFNYIDRRLSQIKKDVSQLSKALDTFTKVVADSSAKSAKSFGKSMDKHLDIIRVFDRESKARMKIVTKHFKSMSKSIQNWNDNLKKQTKMLSDALKTLEEMAKEEEYED